MLEIGKAVKILRNAKDISISELAKSSGISISFLSLLEKGERQPSLEVIRKVSEALDIPSEVLILFSMKNNTSLLSNDSRIQNITNSLQKLIDAEQLLIETLD